MPYSFTPKSSTTSVLSISPECCGVKKARRGLRLGVSFSAGLVLFALGGCSTSEPDLPLDDLCIQMRKEELIFRPVGNTPMGSFEVEVLEDLNSQGGTLIIDDDDLSDDYGGWKSNPEYGWLQALDAFNVWSTTYAQEIALLDQIPEGTTVLDIPPGSPEAFAVEEATIFYAELAAAHCASSELYKYVIGEPVAPPTFVECKDRFYANGDGVIGLVDLTETVAEIPASDGDEELRRSSTYFELRDQDRQMAQCPRPETVFSRDEDGELELDSAGKPIVIDASSEQLPNEQALNFWAPLTTSVTSIAGASSERDGHTFSGVTVPLSVAIYKRTFDASEWEGIGFWARLADADQAIPSDRLSPAGLEPLSGRKRPLDAKAQTGKNSLALIIQTLDTAAVDEGGLIKFTPDSECQVAENGQEPDPMAEIVPCFEDQAAFDAFTTPLQQEFSDDGEVTREFKAGVYSAEGLPLPVPFPYCVDYSPADAPTEGEVPFRDQCWDGFRTVREISKEWKFHFVPFEEMRQSGSGRIAEGFRLDRIKSINVFASVFQPVNVLIDEVSFYKSR